MSVRRLSLGGLLLCVVSLAVAFGGADLAFASAPEAPTVEVSSFTDGSAFFSGVLNPAAAGDEGTYEFVYAASSSTCTGEAKGRRGLAFGMVGEPVSEEVTGLAPDTTYTVCLLARNLAGEETLGSAKTFTTSYQPEAPETTAAGTVSSSSAVLNGVLNPVNARTGEPGLFEFVYRRSGSECEGEGEGSTGMLSESQGKPLAGEVKEPVGVEVGGLAPNVQYTACVRAWNATGQYAQGGPVSFTTLPASPTVSNERVVRVSQDSATVSAEIATGGEAASYSVVYGSTSNYGSETPAASVSVDGAVSVTLTGLQPATGYHFAFRMANKVGGEQGADTMVTTYPVGAGGLPDNRTYEMVSPAYNPYDMEVYEVTTGVLPSTEKPFLSSPDGNTVVYGGMPSVAGTGGQGENPQQYRAVRSPQGGWTQTNISPDGGGLFEQYAGFSSDLSMGVIPNFALPAFGDAASFENTEPQFKAPLGESELSRVNSYQEIYAIKFDEGIFRPLFSSAPLFHRKIPYLYANEHALFTTYYSGASANFSQFLFEADDDMSPEGVSAQAEAELVSHTKQEGEYTDELKELGPEEHQARLENNQEKINELVAKIKELKPLTFHMELYSSSGGRVGLVNVGPGGELVAGAAFGDAVANPTYDNYGLTEKNIERAVSSDGSRVFWSGVNTDPGVVFVRVGGVRTEQVSAGAAQYWDASPDGRFAYYTEEGDLWRFDVDSDTREVVAGSGAGVQGVIGGNQTGESGAYVYFVAEGVLTGEEENAEGQKAQAGYDNLYVSEPDSAHPGGHITRFIARLEGGEGSDWARLVRERTAEVSPDGRSLVFESSLNLLGRSYGGEGAAEVYDYRVGDGRLFCVSCRPQASGGRLVAPEVGLQTRRWVSEDDARVFFDSEAPLVQSDVDGVNDVYEWEADGTGSCREVEGCVYLISSGVEAAAYFADASANGDNVFMATRQRLVPEDQNEFSDLYDARVDGVRSVAPPQCTGTGCQGVPAPAPIFATPSSVTFNGVGNFPPTTTRLGGTKAARSLTRTQKLKRALAVCHRKKSRRQRTKCEAHAHKLYGAASNARRTK